MIARAKARFIRISPRKFRQVIPLVKYKPVEEAIGILRGMKRRASRYAVDLLTSALANAQRLHEGIDAADIFVSKFTADGGPQLKRYRAASMGRAVMIRKRTSHLLVELDAVKKPAGKKPEKKTSFGMLGAKKRPRKAEEKTKKTAASSKG